jgi:hypothetical protein
MNGKCTDLATNGPLNCPKGYGLCYGCKVWCDHPQAHEINRQHDNGWIERERAEQEKRLARFHPL